MEIDRENKDADERVHRNCDPTAPHVLQKLFLRLLGADFGRHSLAVEIGGRSNVAVGLRTVVSRTHRSTSA